MNVEDIKKDLYLLLQKHSINIDELSTILDDIFYEKYNSIYKSYSTNCGEDSKTVNTSSSSTSVRDCQCTCNTNFEEDLDIKKLFRCLRQ